MTTALWIAQGLLAVAFLMAGTMKILQPKEKLAEQMGWVNDFSQTQIRGIGMLEVLGAIGLVAPMVLNFWKFFTPLAALGLILLMLGAAYTHNRRGNETQMIMANAVLLLIATFVLWGRFALLSF